VRIWRQGAHLTTDKKAGQPPNLQILAFLKGETMHPHGRDPNYEILWRFRFAKASLAAKVPLLAERLRYEMRIRKFKEFLKPRR